MYTTLAPGAIGIRGISLQETIDLAKQTGFQSVTFDVREVSRIADEHGISHVKDLFESNQVRPGYWGLPVAWSNDEKRGAELADLPKYAAVALELGCDRACSGVMPATNDRPFDEQMSWTLERLTPVAQSLKQSGARLGLEFIGPKTLRQQFTYEFVYSLSGMMDLARQVGTGNVGLLLDIWHVYTSHSSNDEISGLNESDVVAVHVNDAPPGIPVDEQQDLVRALPMETGVLDLVGFMARLQEIGYDGPVMPEPFSKRVEALAASDPVAAARETAASMTALWKAAGLA